MGKFDGVLLVSDFDDTLCDNTYYIPERSLKALDYFIHHHDVRFEAYAKCIDAILQDEKNKKDAA